MNPFSGCQPMLTAGGRRCGPFPVHAEVDRVGERANRVLGRGGLVVVALGEEDAGEEQRRVDGGQLDLLKAPSGRHVEEVIVEAAISGRVRTGRILRRRPEETQRREGAVGGCRARDPAMLDAAGVGGGREPDGGDARERRGGPAVGSEPVARRRQVPEIVERAVLHGVEKGGGIGREPWAPGGGGTGPQGPGDGERRDATPHSGQKTTSAPS